MLGTAVGAGGGDGADQIDRDRDVHTLPRPGVLEDVLEVQSQGDPEAVVAQIRGLVLAGRVTDEKGNPVAGVDVPESKSTVQVVGGKAGKGWFDKAKHQLSERI